MQGQFISSSSGDGFALIRVEFPHDLSPAEQEQAVTELLAAGDEAAEPMVVLDLGGMDAAYSRFLGALLSLRRQQRRRGGRVLLAAVAPLVVQTLERCGLNVMFEFFPTVEAALEAVEARPV